MFRNLIKKIKLTTPRKYHTSLYILFLVIICFGTFYLSSRHGKSNETKTVSTLRELKVDFVDSGPEHQFWPNSENCSYLVTRFAKAHSLPTRALASYPGSGNTWIRYLIEGATGMYTGSVYSDKRIAKAGHHGEMKKYNTGSTILQKTHHRSIFSATMANYKITWRQRHISSFGSRGVIVVRNPYEAILSYWNFYNTQSHTATVNQASYKSAEFKEFVVVGASRWYEVISDWIQFGKQIYFIFYEDLKEDPISELRKLMEYLRIPQDEVRLQCIKDHSTGSFHRKKHISEDPFTEEHHQIIKSVIDNAENVIYQFNGRKLPTQKYKYYHHQ